MIRNSQRRESQKDAEPANLAKAGTKTESGKTKAIHEIERKAVPERAQTSRPSSRLVAALGVTAVFFVIAGFGLLHHEMWRDEHQAWLVARDAHSIPQLFDNLKYEGNPALWHFCLFLLTAFTSNPVWMQVLHLLVACGFIFVFNRYCGLPLVYKALFSFGYFPVYEYAVISRGYGLGILLTFAACALYRQRSSSYVLIGLVLGLLANVTIYGAIISLGLAGVLVLDYFLARKQENRVNRPKAGTVGGTAGAGVSKKLQIGAAIYLLLLAGAVWQIIPRKDNAFPAPIATTLFNYPVWLVVFSKLFTTYLYIPSPQGMHFWNTSIFLPATLHIVSSSIWEWLLANPTFLWGCVFLPPILFLSCLLVFLRRPLVLLLYASVTLALLGIHYYTSLLHVRYCGHLLIVVVVCFWLAGYYPERKYRHGGLRVLSTLGERIQRPLLGLFLVANLAGAVVAYAKARQFEFTPSRDAARFIKENKLEALEMVGIVDYTASSIASYCNRQIYYPQRGEFGSFVRWDSKRQNQFTDTEMYQWIAFFMRQGRTECLLITDRPPHTPANERGISKVIERGLISSEVKFDLLRGFGAGIVEDERYYLYLVRKVDLPKDHEEYPTIDLLN
jgi:hypothetical protein